MIKLGVDPLAANMFVLYHAVLSAITPPVCLAAFAGAAIAEANAMQTGFQSVKLGVIAFIVPFFFVYEPALLLKGSPADIILAVISASLGLIALAAGLQGYLLRSAGLWQRAVLVAAGLMLIIPGMVSDLLGLGGFALILLSQKIRRN